MLIKAGADPLKKNTHGDTALHFAFASGEGAIMRAILPHIAASSQLQNLLPLTDCPDPIGSMREAVRYEFNINRKDRLRNQVDAGNSAELCWSMLRVSPLCFDLSDNDIFNVMADSEDPTLWSFVVCDLSGQHHPMTGDTLLHVAVRSNKLYAVESLMRVQVNPFWRNLDGLRPINLARDKEIIARLQSYSVFQPTRSQSIESTCPALSGTGDWSNHRLNFFFFPLLAGARNSAVAIKRVYHGYMKCKRWEQKKEKIRKVEKKREQEKKWYPLLRPKPLGGYSY